MSDATCAVEGCGKPISSRGWCRAHYTRWQRGGTTDLRRKPKTLEDDIRRFLAKVEKGSASECWLWTGTVVAGYGQFGLRGPRVLAHRFAHQIWIGPIPDGYQVDHVYTRGCRSTLCVNPAHLEAVTFHENLVRQVFSLTAINRRKTHCKRGHEFTPENTGTDKKGRWCRACSNSYQREKRRLRKQREAVA